MLKTIEAIIDEQGNVRYSPHWLEPLIYCSLEMLIWH
jgi:hypothetical protein